MENRIEYEMGNTTCENQNSTNDGQDQDFELTQYDAIVDDFGADKILQEIRDDQEKTDRFIAFYQWQIQKAKDDFARRQMYRETTLMAYFKSGIHPIKTTKTQQKIELPSGMLKIKAQQPKYEPDPVELAKWMESSDLGGLVDYVPKPRWGDLKPSTHVDANGNLIYDPTGEIVAGVTVTPRDPQFVVEVSK